MAYNSGDILARVELNSVTNLPRDKVVNDFAFHHQDDLDPIGSADMIDLVAAISSFYNTANTNLKVGEYINNSIDRTAAVHKIKFYNIVVGDLGAPAQTWNMSLPDPSITFNFPREVAVCASFHADLDGISEGLGAPTHPRAQRRGRVFIGPVTSAGATTTTPSRVTANMRADLCQAMDRLQSEAAAANFDWCVWSRTGLVLRPVVGGFVDNDWDIIRKRQERPDARTTWAV